MTQLTIPRGHTEDCTCSTCAALRGAWPPPAVETPAFDIAWQTKDYLQRIHWWVRLFGIVWIVVPFVVALAVGAFMLGVGFFHGVDAASPSPYSECVAEGTYGAATCARMYPR